MTQKKLPVDIQLYSLRDVVPGDVPGTLRKIAEMGYEGVEMAGYYDLDGATLRSMLDDCGLRCAGAHVGLDALEGDAFEETVAMNKILGNDRLIVPGADLQNLSQTIDRLNAAHARAKTCGMRSGFHNHTDEFVIEDGVTRFDRMLAETPSDFLAQIDIGWAICAEQDVPAFLRKHSDRIESVHVKEHDPNDGAAAVGEGTVQWPGIFDILEQETVLKWYVIEQEAYKIGPMESAQTCIDNMRKMGR